MPKDASEDIVVQQYQLLDVKRTYLALVLERLNKQSQYSACTTLPLSSSQSLRMHVD
jgi:hypothetical protein